MKRFNELRVVTKSVSDAIWQPHSKTLRWEPRKGVVNLYEFPDAPPGVIPVLVKALVINDERNIYVEGYGVAYTYVEATKRAKDNARKVYIRRLKRVVPVAQCRGEDGTHIRLGEGNTRYHGYGDTLAEAWENLNYNKEQAGLIYKELTGTEIPEITALMQKRLNEPYPGGIGKITIAEEPVKKGFLSRILWWKK